MSSKSDRIAKELVRVAIIGTVVCLLLPLAADAVLRRIDSAPIQIIGAIVTASFAVVFGLYLFLRPYLPKPGQSSGTPTAPTRAQRPSGPSPTTRRASATPRPAPSHSARPASRSAESSDDNRPVINREWDDPKGPHVPSWREEKREYEREEAKREQRQREEDARERDWEDRQEARREREEQDRERAEAEKEKWDRVREEQAERLRRRLYGDDDD